MHIDRNDYSYARVGVAVSDRPQGPYRYLGSMRPNDQESRDMTIYQDDDGRAYLVYASENNTTMQVCLLSDDYLRPTTEYRRILVGERREAPAVFKSQGHYYLITSLCSGWDPNAARFAIADSMLGEWRQQGNPCVGSGADITFGVQSTYVLPLGEDRFLFMADRWNKTDLERSGYLWLPFDVVRGRLEIRDTGGETPGAGGERYVIGPLSLISYNMRVAGATSGYSFLRCYDSADSLLLEYRLPLGKKDTHSSNYTETPPGTSYVRVGVSEGFVADSVQVELNVGETHERHAPLCDLGQYLRPFWKGDTVYNETVLFYSADGGPAEGRLLYQPDRILSVRNFGLDTVYKAGVDYRRDGRRIIRLAGSSMRFRMDTSFDRKDLAWYNLQSQWVVVSYTHHDRWAGAVPSYGGARLPRVMRLLEKSDGRKSDGRPRQRGASGPTVLRMVAYGMSITRGMDVSGYDGVAPYMPTYAELFARAVQARYPSAAIELYNAGLPGSTVAWGAQYAATYVVPLHPDLVLLDFGMNDFWKVRPEEFRDSVKTIMRKIRAGDTGVEFILVSNMKFDPAYVADTDAYKAFYLENLAGYRTVLSSLEGPGVVGLDMTDISDVLYREKKPKDCLVNPLHPNDYMARWYAQGLAALLCP
jgi:lysophospholipase L1-like esterase